MVRLFDGKVIQVQASTTQFTKALPGLGEDMVFLGNFAGGMFEVADIHDVPKVFFRNGPPPNNSNPHLPPNEGRKDFGRIRVASTTLVK
jgi:hypothetical protein